MRLPHILKLFLVTLEMKSLFKALTAPELISSEYLALKALHHSSRLIFLAEIACLTNFAVLLFGIFILSVYQKINTFLIIYYNFDNF